MKYEIRMNQLSDTVVLEDKIGFGVSPEALYDFGDVLAAEIAPNRDPGYAVDTIVQVDALEEIERPAS